MDNKTTQLICSLATWRSLRKQNKTQNDVLEIFCKNILNESFLHIPFDSKDLAQKLKENYGFEILTSRIEEVLSTNLKSFIKENKQIHKYECIKPLEANKQVLEEIQKYKKEYECFYEDLKSFMQNKGEAYEEDKTLQSFNMFLINEKYESQNFNNGKLLSYFVEFLLQSRSKYNELLRTIKEGAILIEGLKYEIKNTKHKNKITFFLDTEILFHAMNYNGEFYKQRFDDFYSLVCKYDSDRLLIDLVYNEFVEEEIKDFFAAAANIKEKGIISTRPNVAMQYLLDNFNDRTALESEETRFFHRLKKDFKINKDKFQYEELLRNNQDFNIEDKKILEKIAQDEKFKNLKNESIKEKIEMSIKMLSYISMTRKGSPKAFFDSKAMLISDTNLTNYIAWNKDIMEDKTIPLSNSLNFVTNRLWEFVETSFGESIEVSTQAPLFYIQIALKEILGNTLSEQYEKAREDFKKDNDKIRFEQEIIDIQGKGKLDVSKVEDLETIGIILDNDNIREIKKLHELNNEKAKKEGIEIGRKQGLMEAERNLKRQQKKQNYPKRLKAYNKRQCKKKLKISVKKLFNFIKNNKIIRFVGGAIVVSIIGYFINEIMKEFCKQD